MLCSNILFILTYEYTKLRYVNVSTYSLQMVNIDGVTLLSVKYSTLVLVCPLMAGPSSLLGLKPGNKQTIKYSTLVLACPLKAGPSSLLGLKPASKQTYIKLLRAGLSFDCWSIQYDRHVHISLKSIYSFSIETSHSMVSRKLSNTWLCILNNCTTKDKVLREKNNE